MDMEPIKQFLIVYGLCAVRTLAAVSVTPFLSSQVVVGTARNGLVLAWTLMIYPIVEPTIPANLGSPLLIVSLLFKEIVLGILIGFFASKVFWVAMSVGFLIDNQRGAALAQVFDPNSGGETSPFGILLQNTLLCLFYSSGGFLLFLAGLFESYKVWPVFEFFPQFTDAFPTLLLSEVDDFSRMVVLLAAPIVIIVFLTEFGLGLVNRFAPQLNVFVLAFPIKSLAAVFVLMLYVPYLFEGLAGRFSVMEILFRSLSGQ
jgi:type III secretion protein T